MKVKPGNLRHMGPCLVEGNAPSHSLSRRSVLLGLMTAGASYWQLPRPTVAGEPGNTAWETARGIRTRTLVELEGELRVRDHRAKIGDAVQLIELAANSTTDMTEFFASPIPEADGMVSFVDLHEAVVDHRVGKVTQQRRVRPDVARLVRVRDAGLVLTTGQDQPLSRDERDLVDGVLWSLYADELLPGGALKLGASWEPSSDSICRLLNLDSVLRHAVVAKLEEADESVAQITFSGRVEGAAKEVPTSITIDGKARYDRKAKMIQGIAASVEDPREIVESIPGCRVTARVRMIRAPVDRAVVGERLKEGLTLAVPAHGGRLLRVAGKEAGFSLLASQRWHVMADRGDHMLMKYVENNKPFAQCNITRLPDLDPGQHQSLEGFQADLRTSLGEQFSQFLEASEGQTEGGLRLLRTVSQGIAQDLDVTWIHLHLSNDQGERFTLVFTMDASNLAKLEGQDLQIASGFRIEPRSSIVPASEVSPAATTAEATSASSPAEVAR
ncbi:MAG: hypothetical protein ACK56Q_12455 [Pirellulaceae bacterium]